MVLKLKIRRTLKILNQSLIIKKGFFWKFLKINFIREEKHANNACYDTCFKWLKKKSVLFCI